MSSKKIRNRKIVGRILFPISLIGLILGIFIPETAGVILRVIFLPALFIVIPVWIHLANATGIELPTEEEVKKKKAEQEASVVGRAVVGGIIAGPTGAIVGAISAADKNNKINKNNKND